MLGALLAAGPVDAASRRFALLIGNNRGGDSTLPLRYAITDADKLASVLEQVGGFSAQDLVVLRDQASGDVVGALERLEATIAAVPSDVHTTLVVYYSGHAKDGALRLGETTLLMTVLRRYLTESSADIRLGVIDACEAGAITRDKGGRRGPSFLLDADDAEPSHGLILITSSSANERSQESDELGGSFFTHYLTSGLRGDADESGDQRVTLDELYRYAYHRTVRQTASTRSGVQHPTYSFDLKGNGNLVLSDVSRGRTGVRFPPALEGHYLVFDTDREVVAAEVKKVAGRSRRLAIPRGEYVLKKRMSDHLKLVRFSLTEDGDYSVDEAAMERVAFEDDYAKGTTVSNWVESEPVSGGIRLVLFYQSFFSGDARRSLIPPTVMIGLAADIEPLAAGRLAIEVAFGGRKDATLRVSDLELGYEFAQLQAAVSLSWGLSGRHWRLDGGPRLAALYISRRFPADPVLVNHPQDHFGLSPSLTTGFRYTFGRDGGFALASRASVGFLSFSVDENRALFFAELGTSVGYAF